MLKKRLLLTGLLALTISHTAWAQATGTITGRAVDQADAVLPGVTINLKNVDTGATRSTVTNDQGVFSVPALERGTYELSAELTGFSERQPAARADRRVNGHRRFPARHRRASGERDGPGLASAR